MANLEVIALDETTPQLRAPGAGDGYSLPRITTFGANVGIGAAPGKTLELNVSEPTLRFTSGAAGGQWDVVAGNGVGVTVGDFVIANSGYGNTPFRVVNDAGNLNNNALVIKGGNVGIGDTDPAAKLTVTGNVTASGTVKTGGYTVATLPAAGTAGRRAYVTDATAPTFLGALTGGGAVVCPVFDNGVAWVAG